jgi:IgA Peptidase M64
VGVRDGLVQGTTRIYDNGSTAERFDLVLVGEGYTESELGVFAKDCDDFMEALFATQPLGVQRLSRRCRVA